MHLLHINYTYFIIYVYIRKSIFFSRRTMCYLLHLVSYAIVKIVSRTIVSLTIKLQLFTCCSLIPLRFRNISVSLNDLDIEKKHKYSKRCRNEIYSKIINDQGEATNMVKKMMGVFGLIITIYFTMDTINFAIKLHQTLVVNQKIYYYDFCTQFSDNFYWL